MPPSDFQARVLNIIAANRSPESHVAGGLALNLAWDRLSYDIDIFNDTPSAVANAAQADAHALIQAGFQVEWVRRMPSMLTARVSLGQAQTQLDWVQDSAVRFFPVQQHPVLGFALHPFDLATNKALTAAARREPRDAMDLVAIHERLYPLGAVVWAAVGKDEGYSPELLLDTIPRLARYSDNDLEKVESRAPMTAADLSRRLKAAVADAATFIQTMPPQTVGSVFLLDGAIVQPDPSRLGDYQKLSPTPGGVWPIDPSLSPVA
ncbi:MAG: hypothetical protein V4701_02365 [Pseudomonadota bacterium]